MLNPTSSSFEISRPNDLLKRTGTTWTAIAHIITGVIGADVLSLAWSMAQLGWIAGPLVIIVFAAISQLITVLVCKTKQRVCAVFVVESFYGCGIAYTIITASSVKAILRSNCYHIEGRDKECKITYGDNTFMIAFGLVQIVVSQIPNFHSMTWLSVVAAIMSFCYAFIGLGLGFATVIENGEIRGSIRGASANTTAQKVGLVFQALGNIAFAYPYTLIILEIQDTLKSPPAENKTMKTATMASILITTGFFLCCACFGYAAFGDKIPGNLLTDIGFYEPYWLVDFANACIILHLVGGYQVYSQPVFAYAENWLSDKFADSRFVNKFYTCKFPLLPSLKLNMLRLSFRTVYVISITGLAMLFPYFNIVLGVVGALSLWPTAVYFPVEMYLVQSKTGAWSKKWVALEAFSMFCLLLSVVGLIGSIEGVLHVKVRGGCFSLTDFKRFRIPWNCMKFKSRIF